MSLKIKAEDRTTKILWLLSIFLMFIGNLRAEDFTEINVTAVRKKNGNLELLLENKVV